MHSASNLFTKKKAAHPAFNIRVINNNIKGKQILV